ncbi:uncharacterized protein ELE39_001766 [Cryptosporidium sp. chipmunk genotype I]|uniref:uncharacterized protein n=1 Tax=Cryptosporidium sp. chipmunk genotype I TaxID=1280935 RepID=UPI00351A69FB|nr:hypothetical protein ELE39_001766 [Cryptosporidium sp. chipmunk genotype I]
MNTKKLLILTLSCIKFLNTFCLNEYPKSINESVLGRLPGNNEELKEIFNGKKIYPLVSLEIKTQQLKLEGEIIPPKIVSRRILVAKGVVESRLLPNDVLYFNTNIKNYQLVKVKQLVGVVTYIKTNREEELYSSCNGIIKEVLPQGFYDFEATFFVIYCDLKKSVLSSYFGYSIVPLTERDIVFGNLEDTPLKKEINARKNRFNGCYTRLISNKDSKKLDSGQNMSRKNNASLEYQNRQSEYRADKFQLNSITVNVRDSISPDNQENPNNVVKRVEFLHKKCVPKKSKLMDSSLTVKLKAYRKSLEALKQSVANISDFPCVGNIRIEDDKQPDFEKRKDIVLKVATLSVKYKIWISSVLAILILVLIVLIIIPRCFFAHGT